MLKGRDDGSKSGQGSVFSEGPNAKLEWMYKNSAELLNREEYLLGRSIDKNFEQLNDEESENKQKSLVGVTVPKNHVEHECIPFSIRSYRSNQNDEQVDIQRKIIEDPLMAIRQKEMESRRKILENPVKLKELHRLLKKEEDSKKSGSHSKKTKKRKDKKHDKKKKKRKDNSDSSSSDGEDLDTLLAKKYRQIQEELGPNDGTFSKINLKRLLNAKDDRSSKDEDNQKKSGRSNDKKRKSSESSDSGSEYDRRNKNVKSQGYDSRRQPPKSDESSYRNKSRIDSQNRYRRGDNRPAPYSSYRQERSDPKDSQVQSRSSKIHRDDYKKTQNSPPKQRKKLPAKSDSEKSSSSSTSSSSEDDSEKPPRKNYGLVTAAGQKIALKHSTSKSSAHQQKEKEKPKTIATSTQSYRKEKLTDEEKERRCREMVKNAAWRDTERKQKIDRYREECEREKNETKVFDRSFINKEVHKAMQNQTSVESRLKANINNIQRSGRAMEQNFVRR